MWKANLHPRDARGRFAGRGGAARKMAGKATSAKAPSTTARDVDPLGESRQLADAFRAGHTVDAELDRGIGAPTVQRITLSDGTKAVLKRDPNSGSESVSQDHLGTLVGRSFGIDGIGSAKIDENTTVSLLAPGRTGAETVGDATADNPGQPVSMKDATDAHTQLKNGDKIGLLDYVINETDRNAGNYLIDGDTVRPIDHGEAMFVPSYNFETDEYEDSPTLESPFSQAHLADPDNPGQVKSPFSRAELTTFYERLRTLKPEFEKEDADLKWQYAMSRLYQLRESTPETAAPSPPAASTAAARMSGTTGAAAQVAKANASRRRT